MSTNSLWCPQCSLGFANVASRNQHILQSGLHIFCKACVRQSGDLRLWVEDFVSVDALRTHCHSQHFGCYYCTNCHSDHYGCQICADDGLQQNFPNDNERLDHFLNFHLRDSCFGLGSDQKYQCYGCLNETVFDEPEKLASHQRMHHGWVECPYSTQHLCAELPQIHWKPEQRLHMEGCHHPNPCNDFDTKAARSISRCPICDVQFSGKSHIFQHYHTFHPCAECEYYVAAYYKVKITHLSQCHGLKVLEFTPSREEDTRLPPAPEPTREEELIDIYAILGISPRCSPEEAKCAARERRIATHPDKFKKQGLSEPEENEINERSKLVGFAADIVLDPAKRRQHDKSMLDWKIKIARS